MTRSIEILQKLEAYDVPNWIRDPRTPQDMVNEWFKRKYQREALRKALEQRIIVRKNLPSSNLIWTARLYSKVFADEPWNEMFTKNEKFFPRFVNNQDLALDWKPLGYQRAYPLRKTAHYVESELQKPDAIYVEIPGTNGKRAIRGFGWGFSYLSVQELYRR